jgi:polyhydroxybutyrate depolymerase
MKRWAVIAALAGSLGPAIAADGDYTTMKSNGLDRRYILVVPRTVPAAGVPLIVVLHGTVGTGRKMQQGLGFDAYVEPRGVAIAYPDAYIAPGTRRDRTTRWNDGRGTLESSKLGVDDVAFLRDMVDHVGERVKLDRSRLFVTGPSNGGIMAFRVACEAADLFAGSAPVIGNIARPIFDACKPSRPISLLAINGTADPFVPFEGGTVCETIGRRFCERGEVVSNLESLRVFARRAECASRHDERSLPAKVSKDPGVVHVDFAPCRSGARVQAYWVRGGGHNWPPMAGQLGQRNGPSTRNLDATRKIVDFFLGRR